MQNAYDFFFEVFLSTGIIGYIGPLALIVGGYILAKKDKGLGIIAFIVQCLFAAQYLALVDVTPAYWWHIILIVVGGVLTCIAPLIDR